MIRVEERRNREINLNSSLLMDSSPKVSVASSPFAAMLEEEREIKKYSYELDELKKQIMWFGVSIVIMVVIMIVDYDVWAKLSPVFYRSVYNIISSSIIYKGKKWSKQLV